VNVADFKGIRAGQHFGEVQAISTKYGIATRPAGEISFPTNELYRSTQKVIARWEDSQYSITTVGGQM
jgi:hypothetical protein